MVKSRHRPVGSFLSRSGHPARPALEALEARLAPAVLTVTSTLDDGSVGTLRACIAQANASVGVADTIQIATTGTIHLSSELQITDAVSIIGPGASTPGATITIQRDSAAQQFRLLEIDYVDVGLTGLELTGGDIDGDGGGILDIGGSLTVSNCNIHDNSVDGEGPEGGGIYATGTLTVTDSTIAGNSSAYLGGGIYAGGALTVTDSVIEGNSGYIGGGIYSDTAPDLTINGSVIGENTSRFLGGGVFVTSTTNPVQISTSLFVGNSTIYDGGGLYLQEVNATVSATTFEGNQAQSGGGVYVEANETDQFVQFVNSTFGGNQATQDEGGAVATLASYANLEVDFFDCTVANNTAAGSAGVGGAFAYQGPGGPTQFVYQGSLFADNSDVDIGGSGIPGTDFTLESLGNNLGTDASGMTGPGDIVTNQPGLGPLGDYGGPTPTFILLAGSPAIDAGASIEGIGTDQRGVSRPQGSAADIGAFEVRPQQLVLGSADEFLNVGATLSRGGFVTGDGNARVFVDYGDSGGRSDSPLQEGADSTFTLSHVYKTEGTYEVTVSLLDGSGATIDFLQFEVDVLFDGVPTVGPTRSTTSGAGVANATASSAGGGTSVNATLSHVSTSNATLIVAIVPSSVAAGLNGSSQINGYTIASAFDVRAVDVDLGDDIAIVFHYDGTGSGLPQLFYYDRATGKEGLVNTDTYIVDTVARTITLVLDKDSKPDILHLGGTVFTIAVPLAVPVPPAPTTSPVAPAAPAAPASSFPVASPPNSILVASLQQGGGVPGFEPAVNDVGASNGIPASSFQVTGNKDLVASFLSPLGDSSRDGGSGEGASSAPDRRNLLSDLPTVPDSLITLPGPILTPGSAESPMPGEPPKPSPSTNGVAPGMSRLERPGGAAALDEVFVLFDGRLLPPEVDDPGESPADWRDSTLALAAFLAVRPVAGSRRRRATAAPDGR